MPEMQSPHARTLRAEGVSSGRLLAVTGLLIAAGGLVACSSDDASSTPEPGAPTTSTAPVVPVEVTVTRVAGDLGKAKRQAVAEKVAPVLQKYVVSAFLGDYPRSDFADAFDVFTSGAAQRARRDEDLLTGAALGKATSVTARKLVARVSVLAPQGKVAGATARVHLVFATDVSGAERVTMDGRFLLTPRHGRWHIFGYDIARSDQPERGKK